MTDKLRDAMVCYEAAIDIDPSDLTAHEGLMKCHLSLGDWYMALSHVPSAANPADTSLLHSRLLPYKASPITSFLSPYQCDSVCVVEFL